jgi:hypothetical protein
VTAISKVPADRAGHIGTPGVSASSWVRQDGSSADMRNEDHYPIFATCVCGGQISLTRMLQMEWRHVPAKVAP